MANDSVASFDECLQYLHADFAIIKSRTGKNTTEDFLQQYLLLFGWLLQVQFRKDAVVFDDFQRMVGKSYEGDIKYVLRTMFVQHRFYEHFDALDTGFRFSSNMMSAVETFFTDQESGLNYALKEPVKFFPSSITGGRFLEYMHLHPGDTDSSVHAVSRALDTALAGYLRITTPNERFPNIYLVSGPNNIWRFLLGIFPNNGACTDTDINSMIVQWSAVTNSTHLGRDTHELLITNIIDGTHLIDGLKADFPQIHYMFGPSAIRFFNMLPTVINEREKDVAEIFISIFEKQTSFTFSAHRAISNLKDRLARGSYLVPICRTETSGWHTYKVLLEKVKERLKLIDDGQNDKWQASSTVTLVELAEFPGEFCYCRVAVVSDSSEKCGENTDWFSFEEYRDRVDDKTRAILKTLALQYSF